MGFPIQIDADTVIQVEKYVDEVHDVVLKDAEGNCYLPAAPGSMYATKIECSTEGPDAEEAPAEEEAEVPATEPEPETTEEPIG